MNIVNIVAIMDFFYESSNAPSNWCGWSQTWKVSSCLDAGLKLRVVHRRLPPVEGAVVPKYCTGQSNSPREGERGALVIILYQCQKHSLCGKPTEIKMGEEQFHLSHKQLLIVAQIQIRKPIHWREGLWLIWKCENAPPPSPSQHTPHTHAWCTRV